MRGEWVAAGGGTSDALIERRAGAPGATSRRALPLRRARAALRVALLIAAAAPTAGCASILGRSPEDRQFAITLDVSRSEAVRRTLAAFREQGYKVKETLTSASQMETEPFRHRDQADVVFRAAITGSERSSQVTLTGTYRRRMLGGIIRDDAQEITQADEGLEGELWTRLRNLSLAIRTPP